MAYYQSNNSTSNVSLLLSTLAAAPATGNSTQQVPLASSTWGTPVHTLEERARIFLSQPVAIIAMVICILSLLANAFSICAAVLAPTGLVTHIKLIISLGLSDILLSVSVLSHTLNKVFNPVPTQGSGEDAKLTFYCITAFLFTLHTMATLISLLNLLAMAVNHYVAIMKPLHYISYLSPTRGNIMIVTIWTIAILGGFSIFITNISEFDEKSKRLGINYCQNIQYSDYQGEYLVFATAFITFFIILFTYLSIYCEVRRVHKQAVSSMDYQRNRKALITTLIIIGTFMLCWLPTCIFQISISIKVYLNHDLVKKMYAVFLRANRYLNILLLVNSLCDPIVYAVRLKDVQLGYRRMFRCCFPRRRRESCHSSPWERRNTQITRLLTMDENIAASTCETNSSHLVLLQTPSSDNGLPLPDISEDLVDLVNHNHKTMQTDAF